jgi:hypothetical protein
MVNHCDRDAKRTPAWQADEQNVSMYLDKRVLRAIEQIAHEHSCRPHDILTEALEFVLAKYGWPVVGELMMEQGDGNAGWRG